MWYYNRIFPVWKMLGPMTVLDIDSQSRVFPLFLRISASHKHDFPSVRSFTKKRKQDIKLQSDAKAETSY